MNKKINLKYAFIYLDNPELVKRKRVARMVRSLGRLQGSTQEELNDMSCYGKQKKLKGGID